MPPNAGVERRMGRAQDVTRTGPCWVGPIHKLEPLVTRLLGNRAEAPKECRNISRELLRITAIVVSDENSVWLMRPGPKMDAVASTVRERNDVASTPRASFYKGVLVERLEITNVVRAVVRETVVQQGLWIREQLTQCRGCRPLQMMLIERPIRLTQSPLDVAVLSGKLLGRVAPSPKCFGNGVVESANGDGEKYQATDIKGVLHFGVLDAPRQGA